ncbi:MAG TPA: hypothetical protein VGE97_00810 [Nitrososphaera sp.]
MGLNNQEHGKIALAIDLMQSSGVSEQDCLEIVQLVMTATLDAFARRLVERITKS